MEDLGIFDVIVIGGGLVGTAAALGMASDRARVLIFDGDDGSFRASRGNFGLVWAQSKGANNRDYATWTRRAVADWPMLEQEVKALSGVDTAHKMGNGVHICLDESEHLTRARMVEKMAAHGLPHDDTRMIDASELRAMFPGVGPDAVSASTSSVDGACHSLALYRGLAASAQAAGARLEPNAKVRAIKTEKGGYTVRTDTQSAHADRILIAAGLATNDLAKPFGFPKLVHPQKGQILVTERVAQTLPVISSQIRQTPEGTILIGDTKEDTGLDDSSSTAGLHKLAQRAVRIMPALASVRIVRSWAALRVLTADGNPVYDESPTHKGVYVATTHSGVTLAPAHRGPLAQWILNGQRPPEFRSFTAGRFTQQ
ncbi:NAD(P)/FAD-dependent oxidoreductase [Donghicola eburneus]|uniref:Putative D-nopaline dehydrogenase n=1 Tax=Donghicola eburneus TaxID=393278 RepID=A0A1M4N381_9RHOB|nr:FAD-binding oxidoreductase [Donghicola eburneus]SCM67516.1 putative D-nopaline dehydrogenase [Donghicola eburneus]SFQ06329.1 glycine oxidase [Donghicola eburneus]